MGFHFSTCYPHSKLGTQTPLFVILRRDVTCCVNTQIKHTITITLRQYLIYVSQRATCFGYFHKDIIRDKLKSVRDRLISFLVEKRLISQSYNCPPNIFFYTGRNLVKVKLLKKKKKVLQYIKYYSVLRCSMSALYVQYKTLQVRNPSLKCKCI